jgi:hypothetical protein
MATVIDAIRTVEAMAEIPCLRGGFACFDNDLGAQGVGQHPGQPRDHLGAGPGSPGGCRAIAAGRDRRVP